MVGNDDCRRMNLVYGRKLCLWVKGSDGEPPVSGDRLWIILASKTDIEPCAFADRNAPAPTKKSMRQLPEADSTDYINASPFSAHRTFRMMMSSSA